MGNCLIKQLQTTVEDTNLTKMGELVIEIPEGTYPIVYSYEPILLGNSGNIVKTDTNIYTITGPCLVAFPNYYNTTVFNLLGLDVPSEKIKYIPSNYIICNFNDITNIKYLQLNSNSTKLNFNSDAINTIIQSEFLEFLHKNPQLEYFKWHKTSLNIDVDEILELYPNFKKIEGTNNLTNSLIKISVDNLNKMYFDNKSLSELDKISQTKNLTKLYGDISQINYVFLSQQYSGNNLLEWKQQRTYPYILALENVNLGNDVDNMLIDQARLEPYIYEENWFKEISVNGTRTSASDAAIQTLKEKGFTVKLNYIIQ